MVEKFERLSRSLAYEGVRINLYRDRLKTPEGQEVTWDHIEHPGAAAVLPVTKEGKLLLVRQYRNSLDRITLEIPAGRREGEEAFSACAARELEEETGYRSDHLEYLISVNTEIAFCNEQIDVFVATDLQRSEQHLDEDEFIDVEAYDADALIQMIFRGELRDSKTIAAILAYKEKYCPKDPGK